MIKYFLFLLVSFAPLASFAADNSDDYSSALESDDNGDDFLSDNDSIEDSEEESFVAPEQRRIEDLEKDWADILSAVEENRDHRYYQSTLDTTMKAITWLSSYLKEAPIDTNGYLPVSMTVMHNSCIGFARFIMESNYGTQN